MQRELDNLRESLRDYQQDFERQRDSQKNQTLQHNADLDEAKAESYRLKRVIEDTIQESQQRLQDRAAEIAHLEDKLRVEANRSKDLINDLQQTLSNKTQTFDSQT